MKMQQTFGLDRERSETDRTAGKKSRDFDRQKEAFEQNLVNALTLPKPQQTPTRSLEFQAPRPEFEPAKEEKIEAAKSFEHDVVRTSSRDEREHETRSKDSAEKLGEAKTREHAKTGESGDAEGAHEAKASEQAADKNAATTNDSAETTKSDFAKLVAAEGNKGAAVKGAETAVAQGQATHQAKPDSAMINESSGAKFEVTPAANAQGQSQNATAGDSESGPGTGESGTGKPGLTPAALGAQVQFTVPTDGEGLAASPLAAPNGEAEVPTNLDGTLDLDGTAKLHVAGGMAGIKNAKAQMELNHPELGRIQVELMQDADGQVEMKAITQSLASAIALRSSEAALRTNLEGQRVRMKGIRIEVGDNTTSNTTTTGRREERELEARVIEDVRERGLLEQLDLEA